MTTFPTDIHGNFPISKPRGSIANSIQFFCKRAVNRNREMKANCSKNIAGARRQRAELDGGQLSYQIEVAGRWQQCLDWAGRAGRAGRAGHATWNVVYLVRSRAERLSGPHRHGTGHGMADLGEVTAICATGYTMLDIQQPLVSHANVCKNSKSRNSFFFVFFTNV